MKRLSCPVVFLICALGFSAGAHADIFQDAARGNVPAVRAYLDRGGTVNAADRDGMTLLHYAAAGGSLSLVQQLILLGADLAKRDTAGRTAHDMAAAAGGSQTLASSSTVRGNSYGSAES